MCEELTDPNLVWHVNGYLGSLENKLRHDRTFWGVSLSDENVSSTESLKLAIPKHILERAGAHARDYICATGVLRAWQQVKSSSFEVYLNVTDLHLLDAPSVRLSRREELATLQTLKVLAAKRTAFPKTTKPTVSVIHSRSQEAQVYEDFRQPFRSLDGAVQFEPIPTTMLSVPDLMEAVRRATGDVVVLIRGGGSDEQFVVFDHPDILHAWGRKAAYRVVGIGHSSNTTALDLLSDYIASTPAAAGAHLAELLRTARDTQQSLAQLRAQNDELRLQLRQAQAQHATESRAITPSTIPVTASDRQQPPRPGLNWVLALAIGIVVGLLLVWLYLQVHK